MVFIAVYGSEVTGLMRGNLVLFPSFLIPTNPKHLSTASLPVPSLQAARASEGHQRASLDARKNAWTFDGNLSKRYSVFLPFFYDNV